jgi:hypothetical protein
MVTAYMIFHMLCNLRRRSTTSDEFTGRDGTRKIVGLYLIAVLY